MKLLPIVILLFSLLLGCAMDELAVSVEIVESPGEEPVITEEEEALDFSLQFIRSVFDNDCDAAKNDIADGIFIVESGKSLGKSEIEGEICNTIQNAVPNDKYFNDYLNDYTVEILNPIEFRERFADTEFENYNPGRGEYWFSGTDLKRSTENYIQDSDVFFFMVKETGSGWKITGLLS